MNGLGRPLVEEMQELERRREAFALVTVVRVVRPSSARVGMRALVTAAGRMSGFVGGQCTKRTVTEVARDVISANQACVVRLAPDPAAVDASPGVVVRAMTCASGGQVDLLVEPHRPAPVLAVVGDTPIAHALVELAASLPFDVRPLAWEPPEPLEDFLSRAVASVPFPASWVVATQGAYDEDTLLALNRVPVVYLGVVASPRRAAALGEFLKSAGTDVDRIQTMRAPAGLNLGAETAAEIAVSIAAELIQRRTHAPLATVVPLPTPSVTDPVCGMAVELATTPHRLVLHGEEYGFCSFGCLRRFAEAPDAYPQAVGVGPTGEA